MGVCCLSLARKGLSGLGVNNEKTAASILSSSGYGLEERVKSVDAPCLQGCPRSFVFPLLCFLFPLLLVLFIVSSCGKGRTQHSLIMEPDVMDWVIVICAVLGGLSLLAFSLNYLCSVETKRYVLKVKEEIIMRKNAGLWLRSLFTDESYRVMILIREHPGGLQEWLDTLTEDECEHFIVVLDIYLHLLNSCSVLEARGVIPEDLFWEKLEVHLQVLVACQSLCLVIFECREFKELQRKLAKVEQRKK